MMGDDLTMTDLPAATVAAPDFYDKHYASNNPSLKRPESLVAPEQNSVSDSPLHFGAKGGG